MASALLASRNESFWGEPKVYTRKNPNSNPNPNPNLKANPNPNKQIHDPSSQIHGRQIDEPAAAARTVSDDSSSLNRKSISLNRKESSMDGYVSFKIATYSRKELKELKKRLISELEQVRNLSNRIELREIQSRSGYSASQFSGSYGGREVTSETRPPPLQLNYSLDSPGANGLKEKRTPKANQYYRPSEFVMGKDKMPSENKKVSGSKRPFPFVSGRDTKRPASEPGTGKLFSSMMKQCGQILRKLMKHKHAWIFNVPVDVVDMGLHDYYQIIKHPMDLGTVKSKLGNNLYASPLDFSADVRLTFNNALMYNPKGHDVYVMAEQLLVRFAEMFEPAYKKFTNGQQRVCADEEMQRRSWSQISIPESRKKPDPITPSSKRPDPIPIPIPYSNPPFMQTQAQTPASVPTPDADFKPLTTPRSIMGKQPKPKAKDPNKREMSFDEKTKLGLSLQSLPPDKTDQMLQIVRKRNGQLAQDGDEVELDFEAIDTETLWELDRYVYNCKKTMSKVKRQAHASNHISAADESNKSPVRETHEAAKKNKRGEIGEEDVDIDIGEEILTNNFPPVEIEKDAGHGSSGSSSSSSSGSDSSSSSDSDSGSSSGSDSDDAKSPRNESKDQP